MVLAAAGGIIGSWILIATGQAVFQLVIPWLLVFATLSFALGPSIKLKLERDFAFDGSRWLWLSFLLEFLVYVYGGYFGLGMGIVLFAIHSVFSQMTIHQANAIRNITITLMTLISIVIFAQAGVIRWIPSLIMMTGAIDRRLCLGQDRDARSASLCPARHPDLGGVPHGAVVLALSLRDRALALQRLAARGIEAGGDDQRHADHCNPVWKFTEDQDP